MEKKQKYKFPSTELVDLIVNKELEKYSVFCKNVKDLPDGRINDTNWYDYYTFDTEEEYNNWKEFCLDVLSTQVTPKISKKKAKEEFSMIDLAWGLKHSYV
jgi:hypothetical protein